MQKLLSKLVAFAMLAAVPLAIAANAPATAATDAPTLKLPQGARPTRYALSLRIVPGEARVRGEIAIDIEVAQARPVLWLNADSLRVTQVTTEQPETRTTLLTSQEQFVGIAFEPELTAGRHRVTLTFEAEQSQDSTRGIFALQDGGAWYAMTQFEAVSARRAFPCFDEPGYKTPWQLTLQIPQDLIAVSNTQIESETPGTDGLKTVRFAETRPLPSYLVAFAVGPWEFVDLGRVGANPTSTRIIVPRGRRADAEFAARAYPELFRQLERWFGIAYPFDKLDHIAIPLTVGFAMENAGLITYGAPVLLAKSGAATPRFRRGAANVGAHEIAHQWFGNLVTNAWWDDIWLNEAFATWIAEKMVQQWRPDYDRGAARVGERAVAINADALASARKIREPITSRSDIFSAFDQITYQKGATVIGMFEGWIGEESFRRGVQTYLETRRYGSASADDFLESLTKAGRHPVADAFNTFLNQNGVPQVEVRLRCDAKGAQLELAQHRLALLGSGEASARKWQIPVCTRYGIAGSSHEACTLITEATTSIPLQHGCPAFVFANAGGRGYYVPSYDDGLLSRLANQRNSLSPAEYASLLNDMQVLVRTGSLGAARAMQWVRWGATSGDRHIVQAAIELAEFAGNTLVADADRPEFGRFVREVFGPRARSLGFLPRANESDDDQLLRRAVLRLVAPEDPMLAAEARRLALAWIKDRQAIDPGMVEVVLMSAGRTGDTATFDALLAEAKTTSDRLDRRYLVMALFAFTDPVLSERGMALLLDPPFDVRESWTALYYAHYWIPSHRAANEYIMANFDALAKTVGRDTPGGWPFYAAGLCSSADESKLTAFWKIRAKDYSRAEHELAEAIESIQICTRVRSSTRIKWWR